MSDEQKMLISALLGFLSAVVLQIIGHILTKGKERIEAKELANEQTQRAAQAKNTEIRNQLMKGVHEFAEQQEIQRLNRGLPSISVKERPPLPRKPQSAPSFPIGGLILFTALMLLFIWFIADLRSAILMVGIFTIVFSISYWVPSRRHNR